MKWYFQKALDTYEPPTIPDQKRLGGFDTTYIWHAAMIGDQARRRPPPSMIGESEIDCTR